MISKQCKHAIKALLCISEHTKSNDTFLESSKIAEGEQIPKKFLEAILAQLSKHKLVQSKKGINGGYKLLVHPTELNLAQIVRIIDGENTLLECVSSPQVMCEDCNGHFCAVKKSISEAYVNYFTTLEQQSLFDLEQEIQKSSNNFFADGI